MKTQRVRAFDWGRELELEDVFGQAFVVLNESIGGPFVGLRLISVLPSHAGWELRIRNPKGEMRVLNLANDLTVRK